ncbi:MAG: nicotinate-nucleotide adenylyltransferase [Gammaproteobacteria bacterium]|nr:nicotinate-nucleotide adenylyltransferase [Gammaproteobacteria bacterium]MCL5796721.1 nicotinate-nucleotide adenylyltransferase [Gammaproteobacteria bacterium]
MARIGLMGGTFDPIHFGHLRSAWEVSQQLGLNEMHFIPSAIPVHRPQPVASAEQRLAMVKAAVEPISGWLVNDCELRRERPSYTVDTLLELRATLGDEHEFWFLMGSDAFEGLLSWHRWQELLSLTNIAVMVRAGSHPRCCAELNEMLNRPTNESVGFGQVKLVEVTALAISATQIRAELASNQLPHFLVSESVLEYIQHQRMYGYKG